jgi:hypothetical protein
LIIRLGRYIQHNLEHAERLERMAEEAERWNGLETARLIRTAEDNIFLQNKPLRKAALVLKNDENRGGLGKGRPSVPETPSSPSPRRKGDCEKKWKKCWPAGKGIRLVERTAIPDYPAGRKAVEEDPASLDTIDTRFP